MKKVITTDLTSVIVEEHGPSILSQGLDDRLKTDVVHFVYEKADGTLREAFGTTNRDLVPNQTKQEHVSDLVLAVETVSATIMSIVDKPDLATDAHGLQHCVGVAKDSLVPFIPKESKGRTPNPAMITYYDFVAQGFRMVKKGKIVRIY